MREGLAIKAEFGPIDLYPRDGTIKLSQAESQAAELAGVSRNELILFNSGMSAIATALESALENSGDKELVLAHGGQLYSQTALYIGGLANRGVKTVAFDSSSEDHVHNVVKQHNPNVIIAETVGNGPDVPVLESTALLNLARSQANKPVLILDNTLPLPTGLPIYEQLDDKDNVLIVESGTKAYTLNLELSGVAYGKNQELLDKVRLRRRMIGSLPGLGSIDTILDLLPEDRSDFDNRNNSLYEATGALALALYGAEKEGADFIVSHPGLPSHDNYDYYQEKYPSGGTPLFFLQCTGKTNQFDLASRLWAHPEVRKHAELGQSFGFDTTRILFDEEGCFLRISGGAKTDTDKLGPALYEAALAIG